MASPPTSLLSRRLVIVTGKGGAGKTTVAAALALGAAAAGRRVLLTAVDRDAMPGPLLAPNPPPIGHAPVAVAPGIEASLIDPFEALGEYLGIQLGTRRVIDLVLRQRSFHQLMEAAPGWRELITLGKIWHLEQMRERERPRYDLIVVDAPATGHGLTFLDVPRVVVSAVRAGPLRHHTEQVQKLIEDRDRTLLLPVALAEELPARETIELVARARRDLSIGIDRVVVNSMHAPAYPSGLSDLDERLARLPAELGLKGLPEPPVLAACGATLRARAELNASYRDEIGRATSLPIVELPYLDDGIRGSDDVVRLAGPLLEQPTAGAA